MARFYEQQAAALPTNHQPQNHPGFYPPATHHNQLHHPRQPFTTMYPTPPLPSSGGAGHAVRLSHYQEQYQPTAGVSPAGASYREVPSKLLQPLSIFTERQACTALSAPMDMARVAKTYRGLLMTMDGTATGGRQSPASATEASENVQGHGMLYPGVPLPRKTESRSKYYK